MPGLSGSSTSFLKALISRKSSKRRLMSAQSSNMKLAKSGSPPPMSQTSFTLKMSSAGISSSPSSSPSFSSSASSPSFFSSSLSPSFFSLSSSPSSFLSFSLRSFSRRSFSFCARSLAASLLEGSCLNSFCLSCHSWRIFCHSESLPKNHSEGCKSSMRVVSFFSRTHFLRYALLPSSFCHSKRRSSKPSSFSGIVNCAKDCVITWDVMSGKTWGLNQSLASASESSARGASSSSSSLASSLSSSLASSLAFFSSSLASSLAPSLPSSFASEVSMAPSSAALAACAAAAAALRCSMNCFCLCSMAFLRSFSACCAFQSASTLSCFSARTSLRTFFLWSSVGSPMTTCATFLKCGSEKRFSSSWRSSLTRLPLTSMTM
mmetsp:Transcript_14296/g.41700  ORF Transcript_14296/g.41700 Transcript_14296/m.41700 type:complete len:377 (+) Transcript_14296:457-1587(+)